MANTATASLIVTLRRGLRTNLCSLGALAVAGAALLGPSPLASAQDLPPVSTERLSPSQEAQVREYVQSRLSTLESDDPRGAEAARARRELVEPMRNRNTSVAMRQAFAGAAIPGLREMVASDDDQRAVSALLVAGNIGDQQSIDILRSGLDDDREVVQIGAAAGSKAMVRVIDGRLGGRQAERQSQVQRMLGDKLALTRSGHVAQSLIGALTALPENPEFMALSSELIAREMVSQASLRRDQAPADALANGWAGAMERSVAAQLAYQRSAAIAGTQVSRETQLASARLAGITLSLVRDLLDEANDTEAETALADYGRLIRASETLLILVQSNLSPGTSGQQVMGALITGSDVSGLIDAIDEWVGSGGTLTGAPYSFRASDFGR